MTTTLPAVRIRSPKRLGQKVELEVSEESLPPDHPARLLWTTLGQFDLSGFTDGARAVQGTVGREVYDPRMMLTLWGYALYEGVVHARKIARRVQCDLGFRWIVGDILPKHAVLSAFLTAHRHALIDLLADVLAMLMSEGLLFLPEHRLAQDGTRVRADVARGSFRTEVGLKGCREHAELHLKAVLARMDDPPLSECEQLARERGAMDVLDRIKAAKVALEQVQAQREESHNKKRSTHPATASTTDPEARIMKMANGGFAPAYNIQFGTVGDPRQGPVAIVGVQVTNQGTDKESLWPMRDQITALAGCTPLQVLVDAEHLTLPTLRRAQQEHLDIISTIPEHWSPTGRDQDDVTRAWMERTTTEEAREIYRGRKVLAERPNAIMKAWMTLDRLPVRGRERVECLALMVAVMINLHEHRALWLN